ncbi:c-type cytochrome [Mesonia ostreae]|uniref:C-type cytochrome n=1 Tax=Mesonia ostreae TaxID=861110 RepID=A0ABU2KFG0_9FLAO|nr:c-type cytochrome [Mesonia ostreae]MDT0293434.1 c-type cytochrome [Mesonia ostreae]
MKKVNIRHSIFRTLLLSMVVLFSFSQTSFAQEDSGAADAAAEESDSGAGDVEGDVAAGKDLFNSLCAACHKPYKKGIGPALHGVTEKRDREWLYEWIENSAAMIASGDPEAVAIYEEYNEVSMNAFPQLSNEEIDNILAYVEQPKAEPAQAAGDSAQANSGGSGGGGVSTNIILGILAFVLLLLTVILVLVNKTLNRFAEVNGVPVVVSEKRKPIWKAFVENQFLVLVSSIFLLLVGAFFVYGFFMQVGVDQGYAPVQPIHYSHRIHAGDNQIECKFCHSSARVSKHSGIPSLNVCMNCHKSISEVAPETATDDYSKEFYDGEIAKLYDAVGWDTETLSYTGEEKPVKWVRIHNLPDFAYFNHSQHVSVAGIACQECHGPVQEMEIMRQDAPLTMGWCINCHRDTKVKVQGNKYYDKIHEELSKKYGVETLTAAQMGALECGKCHY